MPSPIFVLSCERSGSTLLRVVLDSHSEITAPHEQHLRQLQVEVPPHAARAMADLHFLPIDLANLLWDRMLHIRLQMSGKAHIADKTPHSLQEWRRLREFWPKARFIVLRRHPQRVFESLCGAWPATKPEKLAVRVAERMDNLLDAISGLGSAAFQVSYERLTHGPARVAEEICAHLGVDYEPEMIDYARARTRTYERGLGDWSDKIVNGVIVPDKAMPTREEIEDVLVPYVERLGYPIG